MKTYNKLVRDNIPQIIESSGKWCKTRILSDSEYIQQLDAKLQEELFEYLQSGEIEELADIIEVVLALVLAKGYTLEQFDTIRKQKTLKNGAFERKLFLEWVDNK